MSLLLASTSHYVGLAIDIAIVIVLLTFACIGFHKGLINSIIALFSTAVVLFIAIYFANDFAKLLNSIYDFVELIAKKLVPSIEKIDPIYSTVFPTGLSGSQFYSAYLATSDTNPLIKKFFQFALKDYSAESLEGLTVSNVLAQAVSSIIVTIVAGILLFIVIKLILNLLSRFFQNITRSKVLGSVNKALGFVFGLLQGSAILLFFIIITICLSFIPKINKNIYPMIQNDTKIAKIAYNTTDKVVEKYLIKSNVISKWVNNLGEDRKLETEKDETPEETPSESILDKATVIDNANFTEESGTYSLNLTETITSSEIYYRLNQLADITNETVTLTITLTFTSTDTISTELYTVLDTSTKIEKDNSSTETTIIYTNLNYEDFILELKSTGADIETQILISIN